MPHCSSCETDAAQSAVASIDDILNLVSTETPYLDGYAGAVDCLHALQPSLVFLARPGGQILLIEDRGMEGGRDLAECVAEQAIAHAADGPCQFAIDTATESKTVLVVPLEADPEGIVFVCVTDRDPLQESSENPIEAPVSAMIGALGWTAAAAKLENIQAVTRAGQLAAGHEALQQSYARTLTSAVAEREERLREQQEHTSRLQSVMMAAAEGIITLDTDGLIETFNAAATTIFGHDADDVIGSHVSLLFPATRCEETDDALASLVRGDKRGGRPTAHNVVGKRKDSTTFPLELAISEVTLEDRVLVTAILRDITERKEAERELKQLHLFNRMILDSAGEGIVGLDCDGRVAFANPAAERLFGRYVGQIVGESLHTLAHHSRQNGTRYCFEDCPVYRAITEGTVHREDGEVFWRADGTSFPVEYVATPMREDGEIVGAVLTFQDITRRKALETQLLQAQKLESIGQLAAGIAHEINTPTQFISDNLRFLQESLRDLEPGLNALCQGAVDGVDLDRAELEYLTEELPKAISQSLEGVERVAKIVRSMKNFSHPGSEEMQSVDLNRAIESTLTVCRNEWKYVAEVVTEFDPDLPLVTCLPGECNQVILNLVINASHAIAETQADDTSKKGTITVGTRQIDDMAEIRVTDTGTGIPEDVRMKIFDPFFTTKQVGRGTGQGLAIARSVIADKHGGSLTFETEVGRGTTFFVRLPLVPAEERSRQ